MTHPIRSLCSCALGLPFIVFGSATPLWANAGPNATPAKVITEPVGIEGVRIARESLTIDLRPLKTAGAALVNAVYNLQNDGPERKLDLLFAFGTQENSACEVALDDEPITGLPTETRMPSDWRPPRVTPALNSGDVLKYAGGWSTVFPLSFSVVVPPGDSVLTVRYRAHAKHTFARPAMYRQFAYILAPARSWAGFGGLDVKIHFPGDWSVASTPFLQRDGSTLHGSFADVPADAIALTLRPPVPAGYGTVRGVAWGLLALAAIGGCVLCWRLNGAKSGSNLALSAATGLAYAVAVLVAGMIAAWGADLLFPPTATERALVDQLGLSDGYASLATTAGIVLLSLTAAVLGCVIAFARRRRTAGRFLQ